MVNSKRSLGTVLFENKVVVLFIFLCVGGTIASGQPLSFVVNELFTRIARNSFLVLSLIIPVLAGMGLNFGIVIGAMATQIALFFTTYWGLTGIRGFLVTALLATPIAVLFGFLVGVLFNKMKGTEMIGGLVLGYFADGLYQLLFLFILGGVIPIYSTVLMVPTGVGVKATIDLTDTIKYALDTVPLMSVVEIAFYCTVIGLVLTTGWKAVRKQTIHWMETAAVFAGAVVLYGLTFLPLVERFLMQYRILLLHAVELGCLATVLWQAGRFAAARLGRLSAFSPKRAAAVCGAAAAIYAATYIQPIYEILIYVRLSAVTYLCILALCALNTALMRTRLGQNMRTVGQNRTVANAAGIDVDRTRILAMIFSTVLASWGQLIFLQNVGTFSTYGAHTQVGQFAIASLLVGGASVQKANNRQAILGVILFHTMFIVAPLAGKELFGNSMIGEYFRVFVSYGVIAIALAMHAWKTIGRPMSARRNKPAAQAGGMRGEKL